MVTSFVEAYTQEKNIDVESSKQIILSAKKQASHIFSWTDLGFYHDLKF